MRNAVKLDQNIVVGAVPDQEDLGQLKDLGFTTLIDVREEGEKFGGLVEKNAIALGLKYISIPIERNHIQMKALETFYHAVYHDGNLPVYAFSRFGRKPLAFLLLFEAVARGEPVGQIFRRASRFAFSLDGDYNLQSFLVNQMSSERTASILALVKKLRPDLIGSPHLAPEAEPLRRSSLQLIGEALERACFDWNRTEDLDALRLDLERLLDMLDRHP